MIEINKIDKIFLMLAKASVGNIAKEFLSMSFSYTNLDLIIRFNLMESNEVTSEAIEDIIVDFEVQIESLKSYSSFGLDLDSKWEIEILTTNLEQMESLENIIYLRI